MPIDPVPGLISRSTPDEVQAVLDQLADSLDDVVNFGTHVIAWFTEGAPKGKDESIALMLLLRHMLELVDAAAILVRSSAVEPATVLLRSMFETKVYLAWLLKEDTRRRSLGYMACYVRKQIKAAARMDPRTQQAKQLVKELEGTAAEGIIDEVETEGFDFDAILERKERALKQPHFAEVMREFEEAKARFTPKGKKDPPWHFLFGGRKSLEELAADVGLSDWYHLQYRGWSDIAHASEVVQGKMTAEDDGKTSIVQIRSPLGVEDIYFYSATAATKVYLLVLEKYASKKVGKLSKWYSEDVRALVSRTASNPIIVGS